PGGLGRGALGQDRQVMPEGRPGGLPVEEQADVRGGVAAVRGVSEQGCDVLGVPDGRKFLDVLIAGYPDDESVGVVEGGHGGLLAARVLRRTSVPPGSGGRHNGRLSGTTGGEATVPTRFRAASRPATGRLEVAAGGSRGLAGHANERAPGAGWVRPGAPGGM